MSDVLATGLPAVAVLLVVYGVIFAFLLYSWRLQAGGLGFFERRRMRREGTPARARVLDSVSDNLGPKSVATNDYRVVIEISRADEPAIERLQLSLRWNWEKWGHIVTGMEFPVLVSPAFPDRVLPDYVALRREQLDAKRQRRTADEERQRALVDRAR